MPAWRDLRPAGSSLWRWAASHPLNRIERVTLLSLVGAGVLISSVFVLLSGLDDVASSVFQLVLTAAFALFVWSPAGTIVALLACMTLSFCVGDASSALVALAIALGCVVRTGVGALLTIYVGAFLLSGAAAALYAVPRMSLSNLAASMLIAAVSGAVGYLISVGSAREERLQAWLRAQEEAERDAADAERERIADELHDVIAHDLTVILMYSRVLEQSIDLETRQQSQQAIHDAAHKSLSDLRRVVERTGSPALLAELPRETLAEALKDARRDLLSVNDELQVIGEVDDPRIPRVVDAALARIVREAITNVLKHGGRGPVEARLRVSAASVVMSITNPLSADGRRPDVPSGGYGVTRMSARARQLGGRLEAGARGRSWTITVSIPLA